MNPNRIADAVSSSGNRLPHVTVFPFLLFKVCTSLYRSNANVFQSPIAYQFWAYLSHCIVRHCFLTVLTDQITYWLWFNPYLQITLCCASCFPFFVNWYYARRRLYI